MRSLEKASRNKLEKTVKDAREVAEAGARAALEQMGVESSEAYSHLSEDQRDLRRRLRAHGRQLGDKRDATGKQEIELLTEETAYQHWHRMLFSRFPCRKRPAHVSRPRRTGRRNHRRVRGHGGRRRGQKRMGTGRQVRLAHAPPNIPPGFAGLGTRTSARTPAKTRNDACRFAGRRIHGIRFHRLGVSILARRREKTR